MYFLRKPIYNNLLKKNNKRFFSLNINNNLTIIENKLNLVKYNIKTVYILTSINLFVSVISLFC